MQTDANQRIPNPWASQEVIVTRQRRSNIYKVKKDGDFRHKYIIKEVPKCPFYHSDRKLNVSSRMIVKGFSGVKSIVFAFFWNPVRKAGNLTIFKTFLLTSQARKIQQIMAKIRWTICWGRGPRGPWKSKTSRATVSRFCLRSRDPPTNPKAPSKCPTKRKLSSVFVTRIF